jgi:hypothetical protein
VAGTQIAAVLLPHPLQMLAQAGLDMSRQHGPAILLALSLPHHDLMHLEVDILYPESQCLQQAETRTVQEPRHKPRRTAHLGENTGHFRACEHNGQTRRALRPHHLSDWWKVHAEHVTVEEEQGRQRLVLSGCRDPAPHGEVRQEGLDLFGSKLARMLQAVEPYESDNPAGGAGAAGAARTQRV